MIDWEDYILVREEKLRTGFGEGGLAVRLSSREWDIASNYVNENGFNTFVSEMIKVDRSIKDLRHHKCIGQLYSRSLPTTSIIIPFFNEHWTTLIRTVTSVLNRTPLILIKEIILINDGSTLDGLIDKLDLFAKNTVIGTQIRVINMPERRGLITARLNGAKIATGDVLIFLDSHCEAGTNWLPPLLDPIKKDYRTVVCPFIDVIDADTFEYRAQDNGGRGGFDWELFYKRLPRLKYDSLYPEKSFDSPVMAGGLFAISKKWFWELGSYDPNLRIWGGEQYELSFKIWMCGGKMIDTPCSRVGHIYRTHSTNFPDPGIGDYVSRNYKRVAEVWMDEYKEFIYNKKPYYRSLDPGDLTLQKDLRKKLKCKSFRWFMTEIAFDLTETYPIDGQRVIATVQICSSTKPFLCVDTFGTIKDGFLKLNNKNGNFISSSQMFEYTYSKEIRVING